MKQCVTVFRSRLRDDVPAEYWELAGELEALARRVEGFVDYKSFTADDGERVSVAVFASPEAQATWRDDVAHRVAQQRGRERFYVEYDVAVCEVQRRHHWRAAGS